MLYIIGSGPGLGDYLTVKGLRILRKADIVVYHTFGSEQIMDVCKKRCELISAETMNPRERALFYRKNNHKLCVELINCDMTFYSTAQNVIDELDEIGMDYEIIPGVSSMNLASALLKRQFALPCISHACVVTYLEEFDIIDKQSIRQLAEHGTTMVIFMPRSYLIRRLKEQLVSGGVALDTPVAVVYRAGYKNQQIIHMDVSSIDSLGGDVIDSLIVIGWVLADKKKRYEISGLPFSTNFMRAERFVKEKRGQ